ncbi:thioredoxin family protein [Frankia sp. AgKG'84/4]|uniref:thioredoxin family protein n=1 Tax=Frankia sp. AgKG'84/4 TaxID=573490 RepID=UPI00200CC311
MTGVWVLLGVVLLSVAVGVVLRLRDGRFRPARHHQSAREDAVDATAAIPYGSGPDGGLGAEVAEVGAALGERATLLQFSTAFCAPCRTTRRVLAGVAEMVPGVRHVEVDAEAHLELVRRLGVRRTPTVLILDADGREVRRASGAPPTRDAVFATLDEIATPRQMRADDDSSG